VVTYTSGSVHRTFYTGTIPPVGVTPPMDSGWTEMFGPSTAPNIVSQVSYGTLVTGAGFSGVTDGQYIGPSTGSGRFAFNEVEISGNTNYYNLSINRKMNFRGALTISLPSVVEGSMVDWDTSNVRCTAVMNGTIQPYWTEVAGTLTSLLIPLVDVTRETSNKFKVEVFAPVATHVDVDFYGQNLI